MGDGGGCEVGYGYMHNSPFNPPPPSLRHSHDRRGAKLTELKGGEELSRNIGSNSTHLGHGFKLWWKRVDFGEGRRC